MEDLQSEGTLFVLPREVRDKIHRFVMKEGYVIDVPQGELFSTP